MDINQPMIQQIKMWYRRNFKVITTKQAIEWKLCPIVNLYGDHINTFNCRSFWGDNKKRRFRVKELFKQD